VSNVISLPLREVVAALERLYPPDTASSWDRVGLVSGDLDQLRRTPPRHGIVSGW